MRGDEPVRVRAGGVVEVSVGAMRDDGMPVWRDVLLNITLRTTRGQRLAAVVVVRVDRE